MSFFGKFKSGTAPSQSTNAAVAKKDAAALQPTLLEKHLADVTGPVRPDGSDKFFGFENYGSTCYCNSIIQCLYYSSPFRDHVINFPSKDFLANLTSAKGEANGAALAPRSASSTPYPNPTSPARKPPAPTSPGPNGAVAKAEESKDSPEYKKRMAIQNGPVLEMTHDNSNKFSMDESLFTSLREIFEAIINHDSRVGVVSPHRFLEILRRENEMFRSAMHQDAHEFLNLLLNQVVDNVEMFSKQHPQIAPAPHPGSAEVNSLVTSPSADAATTTNGLDTHWVHDLFEGLLTSETRCLTCENTSQRDEAFLDLSVDLESHTSVTSCLQKFSEEEMLCERNKFHCDNCGGLQEAEKRMKIKRLPRILALHLKRFKYTEDLQRLQKLFHRVVYPFYLRLFNTTDDAEDADRLYELYAVVIHIGGGPYHGHYVSIIKTQDQGWLLFDDELVEPVDKSYVLNFFGGEPVPGVQDAKQLACAYVLFYQETTLDAMLREQEMEGQQPTAPAAAAARTSDAADPNKEAILVNRKDELYHTRTNTTPPMDGTEFMDPLRHAQTAPLLASATTSPLMPSDTFQPTPLSPVVSGKTKKELKAEEKERKAREKAEIKVVEQRRREAATKRLETWRKQEDELKRVMEESKATADDEARKRGDVPASEKPSGLARFRHSSMSLRSKPKLFSNTKEKSSSSTAAGDSDVVPNGSTNSTLPSVPQGQELSGVDVPKHTEHETTTANGHANSTGPSFPGSSSAPEEKKLRHRFSLSRKKSQAIS